MPSRAEFYEALIELRRLAARRALHNIDDNAQLVAMHTDKLMGIFDALAERTPQPVPQDCTAAARACVIEIFGAAITPTHMRMRAMERIERLLAERERAVRAEERERCAKAAEHADLNGFAFTLRNPTEA